MYDHCEDMVGPDPFVHQIDVEGALVEGIIYAAPHGQLYFVYPVFSETSVMLRMPDIPEWSIVADRPPGPVDVKAFLKANSDLMLRYAGDWVLFREKPEPPIFRW